MEGSLLLSNPATHETVALILIIVGARMILALTWVATAGRRRRSVPPTDADRLACVPAL